MGAFSTGQTALPQGFVQRNVPWQVLGTFKLPANADPSTVKVRITNLAEGNLVVDGVLIQQVGEKLDYQYDPWNRISDVTIKQTPQADGWQRIHYSYDAFGNQIGRDVWVSTGGAETRESREVTAFDGDRPLLVFNVGAGSAAEAQLAQKLYYVSPSELLAAYDVEHQQLYWVLNDRQDSVRAIWGQIDASTEGVLQARDYSDFGALTVDAVNGEPSITIAAAYLGRNLDAATGLYNTENGLYDPRSETYAQQRNAADVNGYRFASNAPINALPTTAWEVIKDSWQTRAFGALQFAGGAIETFIGRVKGDIRLCLLKQNVPFSLPAPFLRSDDQVGP